MTPRRVLLVGDFGRKRRQRLWYNTEHKLANGFARIGCFALRFSDRDEARAATLLGTQNLGAGRMRRALVETAAHFRPHLALFHHADLLRTETFAAIRAAAPGVRLAQLCVDSVERTRTMAAFSARAAEMDISFITTAEPEALRPLAPRPGSIAFAPNPVDPSVETAQVCDAPAAALRFDGQFLGTGVEAREAQLEALAQALPAGFRWRAGGRAFGSPRLTSTAFLEALAEAAMSPLLPLDDARPAPFLYSSNRIAQLLGSGVAALTPAGARQEALYEDGIVSWATRAELAERMAELHRDDTRRRVVGARGRRIARARTDCARVARYVLEAALGERLSEAYEWPAGPLV